VPAQPICAIQPNANHAIVPNQAKEAIMGGIAFSYLRFSTPEQASGDSRRRQLAMAEKYATDHHLKLDRQLSFRDLGVSAFRGKNAKEGALRAFLEAIEHNLVPKGSFLLACRLASPS
jgi:DNA invertase Pin-like site-specific DNA recombinase